tara:strand:+ start:268 stop:750 length:483 start_codon:yes stop_codon:yes gene_type:complete
MLISFITILVACGGHVPDSGAHDTDLDVGLRDTWMQLSFFYSDYCVYLDSESWNITIFQEGDETYTYEDWEWWYEPPDLYIIEGYALEVVEDLGDGCYDVTAMALNDTACPCSIEYPPEPWELRRHNPATEEGELAQRGSQNVIENPPKKIIDAAMFDEE